MLCEKLQKKWRQASVDIKFVVWTGKRNQVIIEGSAKLQLQNKLLGESIKILGREKVENKQGCPVTLKDHCKCQQHFAVHRFRAKI